MFLDLICVLRTKSDDFKNLVTKVIQLNLIFLLIRFDQKEQSNMNEKVVFYFQEIQKNRFERFFYLSRSRGLQLFSFDK